jgi:hypothetical protein
MSRSPVPTFSILETLELFCIQANTLAIGLCRAIFFKSRRFGTVFKFNGYLIFLMTSSSSFFEENWFWSFGKFRIKEHVIAGFFLNSDQRTSSCRFF